MNNLQERLRTWWASTPCYHFRIPNRVATDGAGTRLPYRAIQHGDPRCNRTTYGFCLGDHCFPLLGDTDPRDLAAHPSVARYFGGWLARTLRRTSIRALVRHRIRLTTVVMHSFMDAADTPRGLETQERLVACSHTMAHPETGELVPACVQHSVLDPAENAALRVELPLTPVATGA